MKKISLTGLLLLFLCSSISARNIVINNPAYEFSATGMAHIDKIEVDENDTRLHIRITLPKDDSWRFSKFDCIEDCATGNRLNATDIERGEFNKFIKMPTSGDASFVLIFPPLNKKVKKINFCDAGTPLIFGISLNPNDTLRPKSIPAETYAWIDAEIDKAKRKTLMNVASGDFFDADTARLIGCIKG
ncbi:MAG: hypothetical protein LBR34_00815, partial [Prevotella sp.]|nr:hypothetical protein [Prevotella sp.]